MNAERNDLQVHHCCLTPSDARGDSQARRVDPPDARAITTTVHHLDSSSFVAATRQQAVAGFLAPDAKLSSAVPWREQWLPNAD